MPFAEAGLPPIGLDYSAPLLHLARRRDPRLGLVRGEMRSLPFPDGTFAAVVNFFTSFGYFLRESENVAVVAEIERVLRAGRSVPLRHVRSRLGSRTARPRGTPMLRRKGVHDPPFLEPRDAAHREGDRGPPRGVDRDLPRERARVRRGRARHALLPRRASRRGDMGRLRRIAGRARFASPHRSRAPAGVQQRQRTPFVIPFSKYPGLSPLFHDFLAGLPEFFPDPPTIDAAAERGRELLAKAARARVPASAFRHRGQDAAKMAEDLAAGRAVAVSTGQQVGLFTGPAFTLMKALDTIRIASELSRRGVPAVPVFWALTDDHDLQEIARTARPTHEGPEELVLEGADRQNRQPVGRLRIPERVREILDAFKDDPQHDPRRRRPDPRGVRRAQRSGNALRRGLHRDAPRSRGPRSSPRPRPPRPGGAARHGRVLPDGRRKGRRDRGHAPRDRGPAGARRQTGPGAAAGRVFVLPDRRAGPPASDERGRCGRARALRRGASLRGCHNPAGPEVVSHPHGGKRARGGGDRLPRPESSDIPPPRNPAAGARAAHAHRRPGARGTPPRRAAAGFGRRAAAAAGRGRSRIGAPGGRRRAPFGHDVARARTVSGPSSRAWTPRSPERSRTRRRRSPTSSSSSPSAPARPRSGRAT